MKRSEEEEEVSGRSEGGEEELKDSHVGAHGGMDYACVCWNELGHRPPCNFTPESSTDDSRQLLVPWQREGGVKTWKRGGNRRWEAGFVNVCL